MDGENGNAAGQGQQNGQGTGTPPGQQGGENKPETINMTSEQLAERLSRAEGSALNKLFEGLGVKNADELKALLTTGKSAIEAEEKRKNDELSATEKLQKQIDKLTEERDTALASVENMKQEARIQTRNAAIMEAAKEAVNPKDVLRWAEAEMKEALEKVLGEDGTVDDKSIKAIVEAAKKANPHYFQPPRPGSPSNRNGQPATGNTKEMQDARSKLIKQIRGSF